MAETPTEKNPQEAAERTPAYQVLARKYRPATFDQVLGQEAMVQTLSNAFKAGRIAQAYMLTGVRGIGKTTTARLIARALNYVGPDGISKPTTDFSVPGEHCQAIMESRHVDVIEMDAASNTGIKDVREIIDSVRYKPVSAPYKVYIIDEIHMLSRSAFNALLKTLEEPPEHVKFVFATTEIRKVPVTVLSRCQRFDLRRLDASLLVKHFADIASKEGVEAEEEALQLIARASEGSARDGLSLLDQAIAYGGTCILSKDVRSMLGLVDRAHVIDLFEAVMGGKIADALELVASQYKLGADPHTILSDFAGFVHWVTRIKVLPQTSEDATYPEIERTRGKQMAEKLSMPVLTRAWQIALKGLDEVATAANGLMAAEMVFIRLAYAADLPTPEHLVKKLREPSGDAPTGAITGNPTATPPLSPSPASSSAQTSPATLKDSATASPDQQNVVQMMPHAQTQPIDEQIDPQGFAPSAPAAEVTAAEELAISSFVDVVALAGKMRDIKLKVNLEKYVRPIRVTQGKIEIALEPGAPHGLTSELSRKMESWTNQRWMVLVAREGGEQTIARQREDQRDTLFRQAKSHPVVKSVFEIFPQATLVDVRDMVAENQHDGSTPEDNADE